MKASDTMFVLSFCLATAHWYLPERNLYLVWCLTFVASTKGHHWITWLWRPMGFMLTGPLGLLPMEKQFLSGYHLLGTQEEKAQSFCV